MKTRVRELIEIGDKLFSGRSRFMNLCQEEALHFYPERADFTGTITSEDPASHLMTGAPALMRRDLANALSAMLRRRNELWFRARTHSETINNDAGAKAFLDHISEAMRTSMYQKGAQFVRATKQGDNDFVTFGQTVIWYGPNRNRDGLLFRCEHIRDVAWCENDELVIDAVHHNWRLGARNLERKYQGKVASQVARAAQDDPYRDIKCRRIVIPADDYDFKQATGYAVRKLPFIAIDLDVENDFVLREQPLKRLNYVIPRWATVSGSQYAISPATLIALPDARLLQQITLTLLEAGQKVVDPPAVYTKEAIQGPLQLFAGGATAIDIEYDERLGDALRYLQIDAKGLNWGGEREKIVSEAIKASLFLNQIDVPYPEGDMTATEYRGRVEQYVMRALPLFEPMEVEYNGGLCEAVFETHMDMPGLSGFGELLNGMPDILRGQDIRWEFESPLQAATERAKTQSFIQISQLSKLALEMDPGAGTVRDIDVSKAYRDAMSGTGAPADWIVPKDDADKAKDTDKRAAAMRAQVADLHAAAQAAAQGGQAADAVGIGAKSLETAGLV